MLIDKPLYPLDKSEHGWVLQIPEAKRTKALAAWSKRYWKLFNRSIKDFNYLDVQLVRMEVMMYERYSALKWPELMTMYVYGSPDVKPGQFLISRKAI